MLATIVFPPAFIMLVHAYFKYQHSSTPKKDKTLKGLQDSEFFWGILAKLEAGIESSGQLIVQTWLVSKIFNDETFSVEFMGIIRGIVLSKSASTIEKSIGKMLLSITSVVFSIGGCYRFQKRRSITLVDTIPIFLSLLTQIISRIFAFLIFFSTGQSFDVWMPSFFVVHSILVLTIKISFEFDWRYPEGTLSQRILVYLRRFGFVLMGAATSFLVYVDMRDKDGRKRKSTFQVHFYYQLLILVENISLAVTPLLIGEAVTNLPYDKLPKKWLPALPLLMLCLWLLSCICMILFYKVFHPWKAINGGNVRGTMLCECASPLRDCEVEEVPAESDIETEYFKSKFGETE